MLYRILWFSVIYQQESYHRTLNIVLCALQETLFIHSLYISLHLLIPNSQFIHIPPSSPLATTSLEQNYLKTLSEKKNQKTKNSVHFASLLSLDPCISSVTHYYISHKLLLSLSSACKYNPRSSQLLSFQYHFSYLWLYKKLLPNFVA